MDDPFTRRGFVGLLAAGTASALWLPKARAVDEPSVVARWEPLVSGRQLQLALHVKVRGSEIYEAAPRAIEVRGTLQIRREELALRFEPSPVLRDLPRTRSGRRLERRVWVGEDEVRYDTFHVALPSGARRGSARLEIETAVRGSLTDYAEPHRALVAALGRLRASIPVQLT